MKDASGNNHYSIPPFASGVAFGDHGQIEPVTDGRDSEACIARLRERFGYNEEEAMELIEEVTESFGGASRRNTTFDYRKMHAIIEQAWRFKRDYIKNNGDPDLAERCCALIIGFPMVAGSDNQRGLVEILSRQKNILVSKAGLKKAVAKLLATENAGLVTTAAVNEHFEKLISTENRDVFTKASVNKCLKYFKSKLPELPDLQGQRSKDARKRMSDGRNKQLTK